MDSIEESIRVAETAKENMEMHLLETLMGTAIAGMGEERLKRKECIVGRTNAYPCPRCLSLLPLLYIPCN